MNEEITFPVLAFPPVRPNESTETMSYLVKRSNYSKLLLLLVCVSPSGISVAQDQQAHTEAITIVDATRDRKIPVLIYFPERDLNCRSESLCQVALLSSGYGIQHSEYSFIANALSKNGYLVAAIQHEFEEYRPYTSIEQ